MPGLVDNLLIPRSPNGEKPEATGTNNPGAFAVPTFSMKIHLHSAPSYLLTLEFQANNNDGPGVVIFPRFTTDPGVQVLFRPFSEQSDADKLPPQPSRMQLPPGGFACFVGKKSTGPLLLPAVYRTVNQRMALFHLAQTTAANGAWTLQETPSGEGFAAHFGGNTLSIDSAKFSALTGANGPKISVSSQIGEFSKYPSFPNNPSPNAQDRVYCLFASMTSQISPVSFASTLPANTNGTGMKLACALPSAANQPARDFAIGTNNHIQDASGSTAGGLLANHNLPDDPACSSSEHGLYMASDSCYMSLDPTSALRFAQAIDKPDPMDPSKHLEDLSCIEFTGPNGETCYEPVTGCHEASLAANCPPDPTTQKRCDLQPIP